MSKAARIRALYAQGLSTGEIAELVGCQSAYVRVVARQRIEQGGISKADITYLARKYGSLKEYYAVRNAQTRSQRLAYYRKRWHSDPSYRTRKYEQARLRRQRHRNAEARP